MARTAWSREGPSGSLREVAIAVGALRVGERVTRVSRAATLAVFEVFARGAAGAAGSLSCLTYADRHNPRHRQFGAHLICSYPGDSGCEVISH